MLFHAFVIVDTLLNCTTVRPSHDRGISQYQNADVETEDRLVGQTVIFGCELIDDDEIALSQWNVILRTASNCERPRKYFIFLRKRVLIIFSDSFPVAGSKHLEKDIALTQKQQNYLTISCSLHSICKPVLSCRRTGEGADTHLEDVKSL